MKRKLRLQALLLTLVLVAIPTLVALAKQIGSLSITGPGIEGEITFDSHADVNRLMDAGLIDTTNFMQAPAQELGTPYTLTVTLNMDGRVLPFMRMDYYPMQAGQAGYVHITGRLDGESLREADDWMVMPLKADSVLRDLLGARGVELQAAVFPESAAPQAAFPASLAAPSQPLLLYLAAAAAALILLTGAIVLRRRRRAAAS